MHLAEEGLDNLISDIGIYEDNADFIREITFAADGSIARVNDGTVSRLAGDT